MIHVPNSECIKSSAYLRLVFVLAFQVRQRQSVFVDSGHVGRARVVPSPILGLGAPQRAKVLYMGGGMHQVSEVW